MSAAVVANSCADIFRNAVQISDQIFNGFALQIRSVCPVLHSGLLRKRYGDDRGESPLSFASICGSSALFA